MDITANDFESYVAVQQSGITNMFDTRMVGELSGLSKEQILDIMENYSQYSEEFK